MLADIIFLLEKPLLILFLSVRIARDKEEWFADRLYNDTCGKFWGTDETEIMRIIISRSEVSDLNLKSTDIIAQKSVPHGINSYVLSRTNPFINNGINALLKHGFDNLTMSYQGHPN